MQLKKRELREEETCQGVDVIDLGVLPGDHNSDADDINSGGWVVGSTRLDPRRATGVNDRGQIVDWGTRNGRGFMLTPRR